MQETQAVPAWRLGQEDLLEKEMATHLSILAWKIPWMEDPGRLQSTGLQRVRQDWVTSLSFHNLLRLQLTGVRWRGGIILLISYSGTQTNSAATIPTVDCHYARDLKNMQIELWILMLQLHYFFSLSLDLHSSRIMPSLHQYSVSRIMCIYRCIYT